MRAVDKGPYDSENPANPSNRRIAIILLRRTGRQENAKKETKEETQKQPHEQPQLPPASHRPVAGRRTTTRTTPVPWNDTRAAITMKHNRLHRTRFFFTTAPLSCPYLENRVERRVVTELIGREAERMNDALSQAGFRRSHNVAYAPVCRDCDACVAVRVRVREFSPSRTQRRVWKLNQTLDARECPPVATTEQFDLFTLYQISRHSDGDMAKMDSEDYQALVEDTPVRTSLVEFRGARRQLVAACLLDRLGDGLSAVYSFFDPELCRHSLGTYIILWLIEHAHSLALPHVYLGYWIAESPKMSYKAAFRPLEGYSPEGWRLLGEDGLATDDS
jgi:arginyl-tRNA--protein-N-Asp/Glu arginylyltransferase